MSCRICGGHSECLRSVLEVKPGVFFDSFRGLGREVLSLRGFWFNARTGLGIRRGISRPGSRILGFGKGAGVNAFRVESLERGEDVSSYFRNRSHPMLRGHGIQSDVFYPWMDELLSALRLPKRSMQKVRNWLVLLC